jgi:phosphate/sulfate permease
MRKAQAASPAPVGEFLALMTGVANEATCEGSTTHVLTSGVAGTMVANGSGLQWSTVRNIVLAWVLTLPAAMMISGTLYLVFSQLL